MTATEAANAAQSAGTSAGRMRRGPLAFLGRDMAVDLGTSNTLVYVRGRGVVVDEPSVVAIDSRHGSLIAVGSGAKEMLGRTPEHIVAVRPLRKGVISDFETTERMLRWFIQQVHGRRLFARPRMVITVPTGISGLEHRAVEDAGYAAGARRVFALEEPMAAAIGAGLPVHEVRGSMVVDIGGGTTEIAVLSTGGIVTGTSLVSAGDAMDEAIMRHVKAEYSLLLGERSAEQIKIAIGTGHPRPDRTEAQVRGRDINTGLPQTVTLTSAEVRRAIDEPVSEIVRGIKDVLDVTPPDLAGDVMDRGLVLTGGGALLPGLDERVRSETGMPVRIAQDPLRSVAIGAGQCVEEFEALKPVFRTRGA